MTVSPRSKLSFADELRLESTNVLTDVVFKRSPVQSKLLRYLVDATIRVGPPPTQYEIAVDALGKDPDFDLANDSYPRVQISRLRTNLDNYYARNKSHNNTRIVLQSGQYRLSLERVNEQDADIPVLDVGQSQDPVAAAEFQSSIDLLGKPEIASFQREPNAVYKTRWWLAGAISGIALAVFAVPALFGWYGSNSLAASDNEETPSIELRYNNGAVKNDAQFADPIAMALRSAEIQLNYSFVSRLKVNGTADDPDYILEIDFLASGVGKTSAFVRLFDKAGTSLFSDRVDLDPQNPDDFVRGIKSSLINITSPAGAISRHELRSIGEIPRSSYECFIKIENERADAVATSKLVQQCIEDFPDSQYSPFLLTRRAFSYYQKKQLAGEPLERSGSGWNDLSRALHQDRFNVFGNFVAAKIELANNNCANAQAHIDRAFEKGTSYPAMMAALEAEATSCPAFRTDRDEAETTLRAMIASNPSPDALLHLYLLIAAISLNDMETARNMAARTRLEGAPGIEEDTIAMINKGLANPDYARANRDTIRSNVRLFIWGEAGVDKIVENLLAG